MSETATPEEIAAVQASLAKVTNEPTPSKQKRKADPAPEPDVEFVSKEPEVHEFEVLEIRPARRPDRRLIWKVPADVAARFEVHHHVQRGRIVRSDANV